MDAGAGIDRITGVDAGAILDAGAGVDTITGVDAEAVRCRVAAAGGQSGVSLVSLCRKLPNHLCLGTIVSLCRRQETTCAWHSGQQHGLLFPPSQVY